MTETEPRQPQASGHPGEKHLTLDVVCIECNYNLRGLGPGGNCPECGCPVSRSLRGEHLRFMPLPWLRRVRLGLVLVLIAVGVQLVAFAGLAVGTEHVRDALLAISRFSALAPMVLGAWLATSRPPEPWPESPLWLARTWARVAVTLLVPVAVASRALEADRTSGSSWIVASLLSALALALFAVGFLRYVGFLLSRTRRARLATLAKYAMIGFLLQAVLAGLGACAYLSGDRSDGSLGFGAWMYSYPVGLLAAVGASVLVVIALAAVSAEIRAAERLAGRATG